ncbi:MAG: hypothetical protein Q9162_001470 [Coniocarpon cinnabarinum]
MTSRITQADTDMIAYLKRIQYFKPPTEAKELRAYASYRGLCQMMSNRTHITPQEAYWYREEARDLTIQSSVMETQFQRIVEFAKVVKPIVSGLIAKFNERINSPDYDASVEDPHRRVANDLRTLTDMEREAKMWGGFDE